MDGLNHRPVARLACFAFVICALLPSVSRAQQSAMISVFDAIDNGQLDVRVVAKHANQLTIMLHNTTEQPLVVKLPSVFAAVPVLPEQQRLSAASTQPQSLGIGYSSPTIRKVAPPGNGQLWGAVNSGGVLQVGPGRVVRRTLRSVCLEYGSPEPTPKDKYKLARIEDVESNKYVSRLLGYLRADSHRVIQLAAWHLNNKMTWQQLSTIRIPPMPGRPGGVFRQQELQTAYRLVEFLTESP
jgi:hypothetical protein